MTANGTITELDILHARVTTLEQLVETYEQTVATQTERLLTSAERVKEQSSILRALVSATDPTQGGEFFHSIVFHLAALSQARYVVLGEYSRDVTPSVRTLAVWSGDDFGQNFSYSLEGTPCATLANDRLILIGTGAKLRFPTAKVLSDLNIDGYCGAPIYSTAGTPLGVLALLDDHPLTVSMEIQSVLMLFAARAGAELERRRAEEALRASEERFRAFLDHAPSTAFMKSPDGRYLYTNERFNRLLMPAGTSALGKTDFDLFDPSEATETAAHDRWIAETGASMECEQSVPHPDGPHTSIAVKFPLRDETGHLYAIGGIATDITDQKRSYSLLEAAMNSTADGLLVVDRQGRVTVLNERFISLWRIPDKLVHSREDDALLDFAADQVKDPQGFRKRIRELYDHPHQESNDVLEFRDGRIYERASRPQILDGEIVGRVWSFHDITDLKRMESALRTSEERLALAARGSTDAWWDGHCLPDRAWHDPENPLWWSPRIREILTLEDSEPFATLDHWAQRLHPDDRESALGALRAHIEERVPFDTDYRLQTGQGDYRWIRARGQAIWDTEGTPQRMSGSCQDITEQRAAEEALRASEERYARATAVGKVGVWELDVPRAHYHGDANLNTLFGYGADELSTDPFAWLSLVHPDDQGVALERWTQVVEGRTDQLTYELRMVRKDGTIIWTEVRGHALRAPNGAVSRLIGTTVDITERKQAEDRLRESEQRLRLTQFAVDQAGDAIFWADEQDRLVYANEAACRSLGYSREELLARMIHDIAPFHTPHAPETQGRPLEPGRAGKFESMHRTKSGRVFPVEVSISRLEHQGRSFTCCIARDVSERKRMEAELRDAIERFDLAVGGSQDGLWDAQVHPDYHWSDPRTPVWWSPRTRELLGFAEHEFPNVLGSWLPLIHPEDLDRVMSALTATVEHRVPYDVEYRLFTKSGDLRWHRAKGQGVWDEQGRPVRMAGSTSDITEQKLAEQALRESEELFGKAFRSSPYPIVISELADGRCLDANDAAISLFGYRRDEVTGYTATDLNLWPDAETRLRFVEQLNRVGSIRNMELSLRDKAGQFRRCLVSAERIELHGKQCMVTVGTDITEQMRAEAEERARAAQMIDFQAALVELARLNHEELSVPVAFRRITEVAARAVRVSRVGIWLFREDRSALVCHDLYQRVAVTHGGGITLETADHPRYLEALEAGAVMTAHQARTDPQTSELLDRYLLPLGITSMMSVPIRRQGRLVGVVAFEHAGPARSWSLEEQNFVTTVADMVTIALETEERVRAEQEMRQSEERFRAMVQNSSDITTILEADGSIRYESPMFTRLFGYPEEHVVGTNALSYVHPNDLENVKAVLEKQLMTPGVGDPIVFRYRRADGQYLTLEAIGNNRLQDDTVRGIVVNSRDITERMQAEEALRHNHALLSAIMEAATDIIFVKDLHGRYLHMNPAGFRQMGTGLSELVGKTDEDIFPQDLAASCRSTDAIVLRTGTTQTIEEVTKSSGTSTTYLTTKAPYRDGTGRIIGVIGVARDITEQKQSEEVLRQREQDLRKALDERERISQDLHDGILQSLYAVGLGLETCKSLLVRDPKKAAGTLDRGIKQLNGLMRELRNFIAGLESEVLQGRDLASALRSVVESLAQPHHLPFQVSIERKAAQHVSREQGLHLLNVVREAVSNSLRHAKARRGSVILKSLKHQIRLTVRDDGIGFRPAAVAGLGHGLTNMAARAMKLGARLTVHSKPRGGTRIVFDLPRR
ncbi:MAG: PAS domain S-box protein [Nitrospiraceae bacterium]